MPFDSQYMISYLSSIVTMSLSCTVSEILSLISENLKTSRDRNHAIQGTVYNPNAKSPSGEPPYKILTDLCTKFEISTLTQYKDMKGDKNAKIWVVWGVRGH